MERVVGIEPTLPAWKAGVLPIYDTRILNFNYLLNSGRGVAQMGARVVWDHEVAGSIPVTPTK